MVKDIQPVENALVTRSNKLIEARYKLKLNEQKVMYALISLIQPEDKEFDTYRLKVLDLAKICGIPAKNAYRDLEEVTRTLLTRVVTIKKPRSNLQAHWVSNAEYFPKEGIVEFEIDRKLKPYLLGLKEVFTSMRVSELMAFKSQYSGRIYELLYQQRTFGSRRFSLDEFKELLGLDNNEYSLFSNIKARIIEVAVKDINQGTPMDVSYKTEKTGNKITAITFHMKMKPPQGEECLGSDMFAAQEEIKAAEKEDAATCGADPLRRFTVHKIPEANAVAYLTEHGEGYCMAQLKHLEERLTKAASGAGKGITNIPKWLDGCMKNNYAKYINPASEAAAIAASENQKPKKPQPDCPKCKGEGYFEEFTDDERYNSRMTKCDCWR